MKLNPTKAIEPASTTESEGAKRAKRIWDWCNRRPVRAILLVSLLAVVVNCYPVIFCGRSYVSPTCVPWLVYDWWPPAPGMSAHYPYDSAHGSDTGAMMWGSVPFGFIESRSLLQHGELPLWDRYGHAGSTLIGQAVSMLGDPLQLIVILGRGSAAAWDIKFIVAKFLFCVGFGLLILRLLGSRPLALAYAALAAYCGAFFYIDNHPVFFVLAYTPWILLSAMAWLDGQSRWRAGWGAVWLLVNFSCFNAGHVESAVVLIGGLNLAALAQALIRRRSLGEQVGVMARMGVGTVLFLGLTAPVWVSFLTALPGAYTLHSKVHVQQIPVVALVGVFDDLFYLLHLDPRFYAAVAPGTSLLVMVGSLLSALRWRQLKDEVFFWVNGCAILLWGGFVFGWIPASVIAAVPLLNRVGHIYTDFSYLLVIHLTIQSAYGFVSLARETSLRRTLAQLCWVLVIFGALVLLYCLGLTHRAIPWDYFLCGLAGAMGAPLLFVYLKQGGRTIPLTGWAALAVLGFIPQFRFGLYNFGDRAFLMVPGPREVLNAPSRSLTWVRKDASGPFRIVGMGWILAGDYSAVYGLEDIRSCAPLSSGRYINLVRNFPGVAFGGESGWGLIITNPVMAQPLLNLLNVKYLLMNPLDEVSIEKGVDFRVAERGDFLVLQNLDAWPRAFFTDKVAVNSSAEQFTAQLEQSAKQPFVSLAPGEIQEEPGLQRLEDTKQATVVAATHYQLLPNSTAFDVRAPSAGVVCLTEGQARDFTVKVNGQPKRVLTVNGAFKGVYLNGPGDDHIEFVYRPRYWRFSCGLFWISLGGVIVFAIGQTLRARFGRKPAPIVRPLAAIYF